jgi:hypothetical protein
MDFEYPKVTVTYGHVIYFGAKFQKKMKKGSVFVGFLGEKTKFPKKSIFHHYARWILVWAHSLNQSFILKKYVLDTYCHLNAKSFLGRSQLMQHLKNRK